MRLYQFAYFKRNVQKLFCLILLLTCGPLTIIGCDNNVNSNSSQPGTLQFNVTSYNVTEGTDGIVNITVTRSYGSFGAVSVDYATGDGSAVADSDYTAMHGTLNWANSLAGNQTISISIINDNTPETTESFLVTLSNVSSANLGTNSATMVNITDDD